MPEIVSFLSLEMHEAASVVPMGVGRTTASNRIPKDFISLNPHLIDFYVSRARFFSLHSISAAAAVVVLTN